MAHDVTRTAHQGRKAAVTLLSQVFCLARHPRWAAGLLDVRAGQQGGNRRRLELTAAGQQLLGRCGALLEGRFAALVAAAGVSYDEYGTATRRLLDALGDAPPASGG